MKALVFVPSAAPHVVVLRTRPVESKRDRKRLMKESNVRRVASLYAKLTHAPEWFARNMARWYARKGLTLVPVTVPVGR